jgi:hypothetical protein
MAIDLKKLDEKIQKLQDIRKIASDPEALALLEQLVVDGSAGGIRKSETKRTGPLSPRDGSFPNGDADPSIKERGEQVRAIRNAIAGNTENFEVNAIGDKVRASGVEVSNIAVGKVLQRLVKRGEIKLVRRGKPNIYRRA